MKAKKFLLAASLYVFLNCGDEPLEVSISYPIDGSTVHGIMKVVTDVSDNVVSVSFYVDDSRMHVAEGAPFFYIWNTFKWIENSSHILYVFAEDRNGNRVCSDSVSVVIENGSMLFADDFEAYPPYSYPDAGWFEIWIGAGSSQTYVGGGIGHGGTQGFQLCGSEDWVRTDGVELALNGFRYLTYEASLMIPSQDRTGALFGFFFLLNPQLGTIYNGIWFSHSDSSVYARGIDEDSTGFIWKCDTWYSVKVTLDYTRLLMNAWLDEEQIVFDLPAASGDLTDTFALATEYGTAGIAYYDNIRIFAGADSAGSSTVPRRSRP